MKKWFCMALLFGFHYQASTESPGPTRATINAQITDGDLLPQRLTIDDIRDAEVVGALGVELGTCVDLRATIVAGNAGDIRHKSHAGRYFLNVTHVDGSPLAKPVQMAFEVDAQSSNVKLANDSYSLVKLLTGEDASKVGFSKIPILEKAYVGKQVSLVAYETGSFEGMPRNMPESTPLWQGLGFYFRTHLQVMKQD